jgi:hypothetical protein
VTGVAAGATSSYIVTPRNLVKSMFQNMQSASALRLAYTFSTPPVRHRVQRRGEICAAAAPNKSGSAPPPQALEEYQAAASLKNEAAIEENERCC